MAIDPNKTVFISYRRAVSKDRAVLIFNHLQQHGYDVFLDVKTIDSGAFDSVILNQIGARTHFVVLISNGALQRCQNEGDWLRREIEEALKLGRNIVPIMDEGLDFEKEMGYLPSEWREQFKRINSLPWVHYYFDSALRDLVERFLKPPDFPVKINPVSVHEQQEVQKRLSQLTKPSPILDKRTVNSPKEVKQKPLPKKVLYPYTTSVKIMPQPFKWITISAGKVTLTATGGYIKEPTSFDVPEFEIAKYPITNAQYRIFVDSQDGLINPQWWDFPQDVRVIPSIGNIKAKWNEYENHPACAINWYSAIAFCRWLSAITGEKIVLPTEQQWQRAAQGNDGRSYPWKILFGLVDEWDSKRCNSTADYRKSNGTTPVTQYGRKGASPFGVEDMAGNVYEWCSTNYLTGSNNQNEVAPRIQKGGSFNVSNHIKLQTTYRNSCEQDQNRGDYGFRIARLP